MLQPPNAADMSPYGPPLDPIAPLRAALRAHYEIEREIGQGAFATVYLARDLKHERKVAIKVLNADPTSETGELRFIREIRVLARLQHPNILPLHDSGHVEALLYYVMPYVSGETLRELINRKHQLQIEDAACIAKEAADALSYAHGQGVIHRDIKPENILLSGGHAILADFGIARAIDLAGIRQLTRTGFGSPGTPAYMSPEQLLGEREIDIRSDIYSVGCVLYEMITGKAPFLGKEGFAKRFTEPPPVPSIVRRGVPDWVDEVIAKTIAHDPGDRYPSAAELVHSLTLGLSVDQNNPHGTPAVMPSAPHLPLTGRVPEAGFGTTKPREDWIPSPSAPDAGPHLEGDFVGTLAEKLRTRILSRPRTSATIAIGLIALLAAGAFAVPAAWRVALGSDPVLDSTRFVILPFVAGDVRSQQIATQATAALYENFRSWDGLNLVPDLKVDEALSEEGRAPATLSAALASARRLGAGRLVWGYVVGPSQPMRSRAVLYDVARPYSSLSEVTIDATAGSAGYARAATVLLAVPNRPPAAMGGDGHTHNYAAWQAYNRGQIALRGWDLRRSQAEFARAVSSDPAFPTAQLWLGQLLEWQKPLAPEGWREHAERAVAAVSSMTERDRLIAIALAAMASKRYPAACEAYRGLIRVDSLDFIGWYGLGECQAFDGAVLTDPTSPSGLRWRSSYDAAVKSFARSLRLEPGAHALLSFQRLRRLLPTAASNPRMDQPANPTFAAYPSLSGDTLAFVPYPVSAISKGLPPSATSTLALALNHNLDVLFELAREWVRVSPQSADAYESLADVLETHGDIGDGPTAQGSAMAAVHQGLLLSSDPQQRLRLSVREGRLRFKRGDYADARRSADSLLANADLVDRNDPPVLITLAALTGRIRLTAQLAKDAALPTKVDGMVIPAALTDAAANLFANAALGVCGDTLAALRKRVEQQIQSSVPEEQRAAVRVALTSRPLSMMVPCTGGASALEIPPSTNKVYRLQQAFARNDIAGVRRGFREIAESRRRLRPTDLSPDYIYQEAWVHAAMGDTVAAIAQLDRSLNALPTLSAPALSEGAAAAAMGRLMAFRAELAIHSGDSRTARHWAQAVSELWANADPLLRPTLTRMKTLASQGR